MAMNKLYISIIAVLISVLTACGNTILKLEPTVPVGADSSQPDTEKTDAIELIRQFSLPYHKDDSLEPYSANTVQNFSLRTLIYDSLFSYNGTTAEPLIAKSIVQNETSAIITLRDDVFFSDGSKLTPDDILTSFELARGSKVYSASLTEILSMQKISTNTLQVELSRPSPLLSNVLTFPIIKKTSNGESIGTGRFYKHNDTTLVKNPYNKLELKTVQKITLRPIENLETLNFELADGTVSLYYSDLSIISDIGMGVGFKQVPLNNLVFLKFNSTRVPNVLKKAIHHQIDRYRIVELAYNGFGTAVAMPVKRLSAVNIPTFSINDELIKAGYSYNSQQRLTLNGLNIKLRLVINDNEKKAMTAKVIAEQLDKIGIDVQIDQLDYESYLRRVNSNDYDILLGEMLLSDDEDLSPLLKNTDERLLLEKYYEYQQAKITAEEFSNEFLEKLPFSPILFRSGVLFYNRNFQANTAPNAYDIFYNIQDW